MPYLFIKSKKPSEIKDLKTGVLIYPDVYSKVSNDSELYSAIEQSGRAEVRIFEEDPFTLGPLKKLSVIEFINNWVGD